MVSFVGKEWLQNRTLVPPLASVLDNIDDDYRMTPQR